MRFQTGDLVKARGREWIILSCPNDEILRVRPISGSEEDALEIATALEEPRVESASFAPPSVDQIETQQAARLLADGLRLSLRRGAGPFRSAAHLGLEPRAYQLVPLLMALRQQTKRLLIADDVGIGKTIEAGMILREMIDRGEVDRCTVLCPPHLVDQWVSELAEKFDLDAVAVTSAKARSLERGLAVSESIFTAYPFTVVSLDYIKSDSRRDEFARSCPDFVIVDEAHSCVGTNHKGTQQRFALLESLAKKNERHLILLTATPHSGNQDAYGRLLGLLDEELAGGPPEGDSLALERYRRRLAQQFVQRRRPDIQEQWGASRAFAKSYSKDVPYTLAGDFLTFQEDVLDYCLGIAVQADGEKNRRLAFWGTLALMRCVGSSAAAAVSALKNRRNGLASKEELDRVLYDDEDGLLSENDIEPATAATIEEADELAGLIEKAEELAGRIDDDPKFKELIRQIKQLLEKGAHPVIFCRFIHTADAIGAALERAFKKQKIEVVTGKLPPDERRARVEALGEVDNRILVATDCLSEGINLQNHFSAVVHYDLNWNPTRHQQREGRVDRFGQPAEQIFNVMIFGENSMIDGAVIKVISDKAKRIQEATGVTVPVPEESDSVTNALMQALLLRSSRQRAQGVFDFGGSDERLDKEWKDAEENAKKSQTRYAQRSLRPEEVIPEWEKMQDLLGTSAEVERFTRRALARIDSPLGKSGESYIVHYDQLPEAFAERMEARGLTGSKKISFHEFPPEGVTFVGRAHPLVATLAETLTENALDDGRSKSASQSLGRAGAWTTNAVERSTTVLLLRLRFKLITSGKASKTLLAEEATALAFEANETAARKTGSAALALIEPEATSNLAPDVIRRQIIGALNKLDGWSTQIRTFAEERALKLQQDHDRLTEAARGGATTVVEAIYPPDIIGLYVLLPEAL